MSLACAVIMSGCTAAGSVENLLTPPKLTEEQNAIYREMINSVGQGVKLRYPKSGEYRSAFVLQNIDDEPGTEALVFYESSNVQTGEGALRLKILDKENGKWQAVYDLACAGNEVDSISFATLGNSECTDIIICYTMLNQTEKAFSVIKYNEKTPERLYSSGYSQIKVCDLNRDGQQELLAVTTDKISHTSGAMLFTDGENGFEKLSETQLYGGGGDYIRLTEGKLNEDVTAMFLDYSSGNGQSGTDVLYCYGNQLFCPDSVGPNPAAGIISRLVNDYTAEIYCTDIDGDGFIEIPSTVPLPGYETRTLPEQLCAVQWYTVSNDRFSAEHYSYFSGKYRFALLFPNRWRGIVSAIPNIADNEIVFVSYNEEKGLKADETTELMRIRSVNKDDAEAMKAAGSFKIIGESDDTLFCIIESGSYKTSGLALTESELENSFIVL